MVTRYDLTEEVDTGVLDITPVPENHEGRFVTYEDYEALRSKAAEILREASAVYQRYNKTQEPDGDLIDMQTLQELADLL